jgi:2-isopropylmalate synthase
MRIIKIFDTTLRDGEQSPGASMNTAEKLQLAKQLARMGVDITIAGEVEGSVICSLARAKEGDIKRAWEAIKDAPQKRIHTFHSTSDIHLKHQYRIGPEEALKRSVEMVRLAKSFTDDVEFSPMDATRTDIGYLCEVTEAVIDAGALTVNIPDTVGYSIPEEFGAMIKEIRKRVMNINKAVISVHCHNDLGLATSNSLAAVMNGAGQIECTLNGLGERAGNCSMEEVVMALRTRHDIYKADTNINTEEIMRSSRLVTSITGMSVQPNKAIVGANAFAHESGIHQDGLLKEKTTYEIITPESIGLRRTKYVLGKHSGRNAFRTRLHELGYTLTDDEINNAFKRFKEIADQKKDMFDEDLEALVSSEVSTVPEKYKLVNMSVSSGTDQRPTAKVRMRVDGKNVQRTKNGDGPVDAIFKAITDITGTKSRLLKYEVKAITGGTDALGEVVCSLEENDISVSGHGADTDIITASAKAYINALNKLAARSK